MSTEPGLRVLCLAAHPDDLELMAGGAVAQWVSKGYPVHVLTFSDGSWRGPNGELVRTPEQGLSEERAAANSLGYTVENLCLPCLELEWSDDLVCQVLRRIESLDANTIV